MMSAHRRPMGQATAGRWLTRDRALGYAAILALIELAVLVFFVAGAHGLIVPLDELPGTDFLSFHAAGSLVAQGTPWLAYDRVAHAAMERITFGGTTPYNYFFYPPVFLLICAPLARLPYLAAFYVFQAASAAALYFATRLIRRDVHPAILLAFPGLYWAVGTGQNALLTAALFAAGTALTDRRPWLAGLCFGALCYKPHFGLLIPVALLAGRHWRALAGAGLTVLSLGAISIAWFGVRTWQAFLTAVQGSADVYTGGAIFMGGLTSPYGVLLVAGATPETAIAVQAATVLAAAAIVAWVWWPKGGQSAQLPVRAAILLTATPIAVPLMMFYDLMLVFMALVWMTLVTEPQTSQPQTSQTGTSQTGTSQTGTSQTGTSQPEHERASTCWRPPAWQTAIMSFIFVTPMFSGNLSPGRELMAAAIAAAVAFGLAVAIAWRVIGPSIVLFGPPRFRFRAQARSEASGQPG